MVVRDYKDEDFEAVKHFLEKIVAESDSVKIRNEFDKIKTCRDSMILVNFEGGTITGLVTGHELQSYLKELGSSKIVRIGDYYLR
ncbi:MAG: hypothetical protein U9R08_03400 [Nanoarchaeota archaeon]|nr:hypothetical protein [Nanoarchaeota archaeon]